MVVCDLCNNSVGGLTHELRLYCSSGKACAVLLSFVSMFILDWDVQLCCLRFVHMIGRQNPSSFHQYSTLLGSAVVIVKQMASLTLYCPRSHAPASCFEC